MVSSAISFPSLKLVIIILLASSSLGDPITRRQFARVKKLLETKILESYPSDDKDEFSDLVIQKKYDKKNMTYYHTGDVKFPVFVTFGMGSVGKKIHVLHRGEDYLNPKDAHSYVVLRQTAKPDIYAVHIAYILSMKKIQKSKVIWYDSMVEQKKKLKNLLAQVGNFEVQTRSARSKRPLCDWVGHTLLCDSTKNFPPVRGERKDRETKDVEDTEPIKIFDNFSGEASSITIIGKLGDSVAKTNEKRQDFAVVKLSPSNTKHTDPTFAKINPFPLPGVEPDVKSGNEIIGTPSSEEDKFIVLKQGKAGTAKPGSVASITKQKGRTMGRSMDGSEEHDHDGHEEHGTKKKHKKKHKSKSSKHKD